MYNDRDTHSCFSINPIDHKLFALAKSRSSEFIYNTRHEQSVLNYPHSIYLQPPHSAALAYLSPRLFVRIPIYRNAYELCTVHRNVIFTTDPSIFEHIGSRTLKLLEKALHRHIYRPNIDVYDAPWTWNRRIRACTDSHCTSLYLVYLPALTGSRITTKFPPLSRSASRPVFPWVVGGVDAFPNFAFDVSDENRLKALLTTPLHSLGHILVWCLCSHLSEDDSVAENGKLDRPWLFPYKIKSKESSE